ncbi:unnamed protein product [Chondrus crispus]|uniref:Uncharacterized protein n=1 Tax=Chondrus crispus TaxID=2769 RepID=R7QGR3_CHOCR|nr:unnamed protein product [Chondrus crispus]CDF36651.1 unnamed protein product [Chondrus crispus]|eukprot:XP_005716470.1 unnamed protein product [Chondrus crispus]
MSVKIPRRTLSLSFLRCGDMMDGVSDSASSQTPMPWQFDIDLMVCRLCLDERHQDSPCSACRERFRRWKRDSSGHAR